MKLVLPGDVIGKGKSEESSIIFSQNNIKYAAVVGMLDGEKFTPLEYIYIPKPGDYIVGRVITDKKSMGYFVDTNTYYTGIVLSREMRIHLPISTSIYAKVGRVESLGNIILSDIVKLASGKIIRIPPSKVPRVIGKNASMLKMIKEKAGVNIYVGSNGNIWIGKNGNVGLAAKAIETIVKRAHLKGLTDEMAKILEKGD